MMQNGSSEGVSDLPPHPHEEFLELCALSTTEDLSGEERLRLDEHLAHCDACREAKLQYEQMLATIIPEIAVNEEATRQDRSTSKPWSMEDAEARLMASLNAEVPRQAPPVGRSARRIEFVPGKHILRYATAALLLGAFTLAGYWIGVRGVRNSTLVAVVPTPPSTSSIPSDIRPAGAGNTSGTGSTVVKDGKIAGLRDQLRLRTQDAIELREQNSQLENELAERSAELDRNIQDHAEIGRQLTQAQSDVQALKERLASTENRSSEDKAHALALETRVNDLSAALQAKDRDIAEERELLQHDRDIRNLISARDLYIAEIYDVAKSGNTQKPFGRIFYTKDKSLVFYGYDLDQQPGIRTASAFQAWGRRGADNQHDVSLGILFQDDSNQKRWVLKFNDPATLAKIDAVFVTVEPHGGSAKPTGKPMLFAYLRLDPNHP